jgi:hypothetical protein
VRVDSLESSGYTVVLPEEELMHNTQGRLLVDTKISYKLLFNIQSKGSNVSAHSKIPMQENNALKLLQVSNFQ